MALVWHPFVPMDVCITLILQTFRHERDSQRPEEKINGSNIRRQP